MPDYDLKLAPPPDRNNSVPKFLIASVVMIVVAAAVYMLNPRKTAELSVQKVDLFTPHTEMKATQGVNKIIGQAASSEDDLYVVATLQITDKLRLPIFLDSRTATLTMADGGTIEATVVSPHDLSRLEETFPQILPMLQPPAAQPLDFDQAVEPGSTRVGTVVMLFPQISAEVWKAKKSATMTISLAHNAAPLTVSLP